MCLLCENHRHAASVMIGLVRTHHVVIRRGVCGFVRVCAEVSVC
jgi:hypothetical protein